MIASQITHCNCLGPSSDTIRYLDEKFKSIAYFTSIWAQLINNPIKT